MHPKKMLYCVRWSAGPKGTALLLYAGKGAGAVRDFAKGFYQSKAWLDTRQAYAASVGWLCEDCLSRGLYMPGKVVHHKTPLTPENIKDPTIALSWNNLRLVCQDHHAEAHRQNAGRRYDILPDGTVVMK